MAHRVSVDELDPEMQQRIARAPLPTKGNLRMRRCRITQLFKFAVMNLRMVDIVIREKLHK
ncbi:hypothetical protein ABYF34_00850 [Buchananella felis]|uniref:hypothetical protein n=1 Tax=Buchananella felis TaxID=3231492 RepID=UPI00352973A6